MILSLIKCLEWFQLTHSLLTMHIPGNTFDIRIRQIKATNLFEDKLNQI